MTGHMTCTSVILLDFMVMVMFLYPLWPVYTCTSSNLPEFDYISSIRPGI